MYAYPQAAPQQNKSGIDVTAWALVALVVAILCATVGWFVASHGVLGRGDVQNEAALAQREGASRGVQAGYSQGATLGRKEAALQAQLKLAQTKRSAQQEGYTAGYNTGRERAAARAGDPNLGLGLTGLDSSTDGAYPPDDLSDMSTGLFPDTPGYASSAFSQYGYGSGADPSYDSTDPLANDPLANDPLTPGY